MSKPRRLPRKAAAAAAVIAMAGCGGSGGESSPVDQNGPTTFRAYAVSEQAAAAASPASASLTSAEVAEIGQRSREWAVSVLAAPGAGPGANVLTVPPLFFALAHTVASAARGETLGSLRSQVTQPSNVNVQAGLMSGVARTLGAPPEAALDDLRPA